MRSTLSNFAYVVETQGGVLVPDEESRGQEGVE